MEKNSQRGFTPTPKLSSSSLWAKILFRLKSLTKTENTLSAEYDATQPREFWCRGFTLIEITIVLALVGVIAAFGVAMSYSSLSQTTVTQERDLFVTLLLRSTRAAAIANMEEAPHGVYIDDANNRYILFTGTAYSSSDPDNRSVPYTDDVITVTNNGGNSIVFDQLSGKVTSGAGTISIGNGNATQGIIIRESGQIDW